MRSIIIVAGAALALSACTSGEEADSNEMAVENLTVDNLVINDMGMDANMALDGNMAMDPATENAVMNDLTSNDVDTNLANGM